MSKMSTKKAILMGLAALLVMALFPVVVPSKYYLTVGCQAMLYSILALGMNFIVGMSGLVNLGAAAVYGLGAYTSALLSKAGVNPWLCIFPVILMGWVIGKGLGYPSLRLKGFYLSLTTIGFNEIVRNLLLNFQFTGAGTGVKNFPNYSIFGFEINTQMRSYYLILVVLAIVLFIALRIVRSKWGRAFIASKDNPDALEVCGINLASVKVTAFTLSSIFGCIAGAMYAHFNGYVAASTFTTTLSNSFIIMMVVGGLGNFYGCIFGAWVVAFLPELLRPIGITYKFFYALIMMIVVIFFPNGVITDLKAYVSGFFSRMKEGKGEKA
ncbi:MAG: branched-chain amino acid ABC transporter permease [Lachnospiraceae bacterium]|nr:branched-chain amino acid ABC transporter permease [Lachnospiraceae bacterium]